MELSSEIKKEPLADKQLENDLFFAMLNGQTVKETIDTSRGGFVVKYPKQKDLLLIDRRVAIMRNGIGANNFDNGGNFNLQKIAFLDVVIDSGPAWYESAKKKDINFTWGNMPDSNFVDEVYVKAWTFRLKVQDKLKPIDTKATRGTTENEGDIQQDVGDGLFEGIATAAS